MSTKSTFELANGAFYDAYESREIKRMEEVWLREPHITCAHPGWPVLAGWGPIMTSWEQIFERTFAMRIHLTEVRTYATDGLAWLLATERRESRHAEGKTTAIVVTTNVFERRGSIWYVVHHHGSSVNHAVDETTGHLQ